MRLKFRITEKVGRNRGLISSYYREKGRKKLYRNVDFYKYLSSEYGYVLKIEKDSYRTGNVALIYYLNGIISYSLCSDKTAIGDIIYVNRDDKKDILNYKNGWSCSLFFVNIGEKIFNIELVPKKGGKISRSAGTYSVVIKKYTDKCLLKLSSGEYRLFSLLCFCCIGRVSNIFAKEINIGSAGRNRYLGWRPHVRGVAMNPIDHPHGGRTKGGIFPKTPWGKLAIGIKTRKRNKKNFLILKSSLK